MREYLIISGLLVLSQIVYYIHITVLGFVWYDKILHFAVGGFFIIHYLSVTQQDRYHKVAIIFTIIYEFFVYLVFPLVIRIVLGDFIILVTLDQFIIEILEKYRAIDEWLDIFATYFGVICLAFLYVHNPDNKIVEKKDLII